MALTDEDKAEINGLIQASLGLEGEQKLLDVITTSVQTAVNGSHKALLKEVDKDRNSLKQLTESLQTVTEAQKALAEAAAKQKQQQDDGDGDGEPDLSKLPAAVRKQIESMREANAKLAKDFENERKAREEQERQRAEDQARIADRNLRDAIRAAGITKDVGIDPEVIDLVIDTLHGGRLARGETSLIRSNDKGVYEMQHGTDKVTGEAIWKPLPAALGEWAKTPIGKRFVPPVQGGGTPNVSGQNNQNRQMPANLTDEALKTMTPAQIREASKNVQISAG